MLDLWSDTLFCTLNNLTAITRVITYLRDNHRTPDELMQPNTSVQAIWKKQVQDDLMQASRTPRATDSPAQSLSTLKGKRQNAPSPSTSITRPNPPHPIRLIAWFRRTPWLVIFGIGYERQVIWHAPPDRHASLSYLFINSIVSLVICGGRVPPEHRNHPRTARLLVRIVPKSGPDKHAQLIAANPGLASSVRGAAPGLRAQVCGSHQGPVDGAHGGGGEADVGFDMRRCLASACLACCFRTTGGIGSLSVSGGMAGPVAQHGF